MTLPHFPPLAASFFGLLAIASLLLAFVMLGSRWLRDYMYAFGLQSWLIALISVGIGHYEQIPELYLVALLTVLFRGLLLPYLILRILRRLHADRELHEIVQPASALVLGAAGVVLALAVAYRIAEALDDPGNPVIILALTVMLSMKLIGFLMLSIRHEAISQILGLMILENGIFLGSQILIPGMPLLIELVILFDLLVAVASFGVLARYLMEHAGTTSSLQLRKLVG
jgi:hydrogenase-4 component E